MSGTPLTEQGFDTIFRKARSANAWQDKPVAPELLQKIYDDMKFGPTEANTCPLRIVFLTTDAARERIKPALAAGNVEKVMTAPVTAILAMDMRFYDELPRLFPHTDARSWFAGKEKHIEKVAFRNSSLQAAYFMIAARAHGLDCGPMSGFNADKINAEFFPDGRYAVNFICGLGYIDDVKTFPRNPRLSFDDACQVV